MLDKYYYPGGMLWGMLSLNLLSGQIRICVVPNNTALWTSLSINTEWCGPLLFQSSQAAYNLCGPSMSSRRRQRFLISYESLSQSPPVWNSYTFKSWSNFGLPSSGLPSPSVVFSCDQFRFPATQWSTKSHRSSSVQILTHFVLYISCLLNNLSDDQIFENKAF